MLWLSVVVVLSILIITYFAWYRPWQLRWGATNQEVTQQMPGDNYVLKPTFNATRAVTVNAPPDLIWGWIVQIGCKRAGWYSYDWVDNLRIPSANTIIPELQNLAIGQRIPMSPNGKIGLYVKNFEKNRWILWGDKEKNLTTWYWGLYPVDSNCTQKLTNLQRRKPIE